MIPTQTETSNTPYAWRFPLAENASRVLGRTLAVMGESMPVDLGSREFHQSEAMRAAGDVSLQYTQEAKKKAKRECLGRLIASLAPVKGSAKA